MACTGCGHAVQTAGRFCPVCGSPQQRRCRACGEGIADDHRFCSHCGIAAPDPAPATKSAPTAERRQLTVVFVDLVGSTEMSARLDPEDLCLTIGDYQKAVTAVVAETGGFIARYIGDGVLIYFGYPDAKEDDPERAVRCALRAIPRVSATGPHPGELKVRIGIATGQVVVGDVVGLGASMQVIALGDAPNIGARLQAEAEPGTVLIDAQTRRLTRGLFHYEAKGGLKIKGFAHPINVFSVTDERSGVSRFQALRPRRGRLVGRREETGLLLDRWTSAQAGTGRVILVSGEPGIGKSRLSAAFIEQHAPEAHILHLACMPNGTDTPLFPIRQEIERAAHLHVSDTEATIRAKLEGFLATLPVRPAEAAAIGQLLTGFRRDADAASATRRSKEETFDAIDGYVAAIARGGPAIIVIEDLHWADPSTREWLERWVHRAGTVPILVIITTRPESLPDWVSSSRIDRIGLHRLREDQVMELIQLMVEETTMRRETAEKIVARSDGLPLFAEELTLSLLERQRTGPDGDDALADSIPTSLETLLASRLHRTGSARDVAQIASVIGRQFPLALLQAVADHDAPALLDLLATLTTHGLVEPQGEEDDRSYVFRHVLIQQAAYKSMMPLRQRELHLRIATLLEEQEGLGTGADPEQVALHFGLAREHEKACDLYRIAAQRARGRYALTERVQHLRQALHHVTLLPEPLRPALELEAQMELGLALIDKSGSGHDEVRRTFERARELCLHLKDSRRLIAVLDALALNCHFARAEWAELSRYAAELDQVAVADDLPVAALWASRMRSSARLLRGEFALAQVEIEAVVARYAGANGGAETQMARDPRASTFGNLAICLTAQGRMAEGLAAADHGLAHAETSRSLPSIIAALRRACLQGMMIRDHARVLALSARLAHLNAEYETFTGVKESIIAEGWARLHTTPDRAALRRAFASLEELHERQHFVYLPFMMSAVAEQAWCAGEHEEARTLLAQAACLLRRTGEIWCEAELLRLEALFCEGDATALLQRSLAVARAQGATWWELRAGTALAEIQLEAGERPDALGLLHPLVGRFDASPGLPDVTRARALLAALG